MHIHDSMESALLLFGMFFLFVGFACVGGLTAMRLRRAWRNRRWYRRLRAFDRHFGSTRSAQ